MAENRLLAALGRIPGLGPLLAKACHRAGIALQKQDAQDNAARYFLWSLALQPGRPAVLNDLGHALINQDLYAAAMPYLRDATAAAPDMVPAWFNLGLALDKSGTADETIAAFDRAIELDPHLAQAHFHRGNALHRAGRFPQAEASLRRAIELDPDNTASWNNLGNLLSDQGRLPDAIAAYRRSLAVKPLSYVFSNLLFALNYSAEHSPQQVFEEHLGFQRTFAPGPVPAAPARASKAGRRLRLGYVSPDLRDHPVAYFLLPLLENHDRSRFEIFAYCENAHQDDYTARIRKLCDRWRETRKLDDERVARQVREDGIDILVDLAGHTGDNLLPVFARRPAPVQATWLGYLNTTGLEAVDYRITDAVAAPPGPLDALNVEQLVRLPDSQWCYAPPPDSPDVAALPAQRADGLTFGSLHNPAKLSPRVVSLWGEILRRLPTAKLVVASAGLDSIAEAVKSRFTAHGAAAEQIEILGRLPFADYLRLHARIDINLDTFPYSGGTTTCHSLWMGVPVLTLPGESGTSRGGASILNALGLHQFIAASERDYVDIALRADAGRERLANLRAALRRRMLDSPLMNGARFARNVEAAYLSMWRAKTNGSGA